ncbi:nitrile hydratase subunit beta [Pseudoroseomonas rhizosphaerae]|uniref:Nitrile hydratase subunit beta n=1 Tax=Teichococcus rhizosphaerae TaxID=1335062 RepID=A0A2C7A3J4_9PROT|nr:nitrile hydratase subunit beta [Pseudoroseomonas rhizosphaerae]PHK92910.1 nitrile hydratase subunit beta [Pseudoroseomonas rhizosphaerae]
MNGAQDLGGMMGFGPVRPEPEAVRFHAGWEKRALAVTLAAGALGQWNIDASRHARESLPPGEYLTSGYYEIWIKGLEKLLLERGLVTAEELRDGRMREAGPALPPLRAEAVWPVLARGSPYDRPATAPPRFAAGDAVRTRNVNPAGHTRLPRYARGRSGVIERVHGVFVFPDSHAHGQGEAPQWLYTVRFTAAELWGEGADPMLTVSVDAWESYLEA